MLLLYSIYKLVTYELL